MLTKSQGQQKLISAYLIKEKEVESEKKKKTVKMTAHFSFLDKKENIVKKKEKIVKKKEGEPEWEKKSVTNTEEQGEKENNIVLEKIVPTAASVPGLPRIPPVDTSYSVSGVENKEREQRLKLAAEKKKNANLANEMKLLEERNRALEDRVGLLEKSSSKYQQYHQTLSGNISHEKHLTCKLQVDNSELKNKIKLLEKNDTKK